jgi:cytosine/adenosine deaminase-related metal-dependent hydrolase
VPICIGTDSNTIIDPLAELREIEHCARRLVERRNVLVPPGDDGPTPYLLEIGGRNGARAIGLGDPPGAVEIDLDHPLLADVAPADVPAALIFGGASAALRPASKG